MKKLTLLFIVMVMLLFAFVGCDWLIELNDKIAEAPIIGTPHEHHYNEEWLSTPTSHYHECECGVKSEETAHTWVDANCEAPKTCSVCGYAEGEALGHTVVEIPAVAPTCTAEGLTAGEKCSVCGTVTKAQETVPAVAHTVEEIPAVAPTCKAEGLTAGEKCSVCGTVLVAQEIVPVGAHALGELIVGVPAECEKVGTVAHQICSVCEQMFDVNGNVITSTEIPALGHDLLDALEVAATDTVDGLTAGQYCTRCDYTTQEVIWSQKTIVEKLYELEDGKSLSGKYTLTGVIIAVDTPYASSKVTVTIIVNGSDADHPVQCYGTKGEGADVITIGDTITVNGYLKNYKGTFEFNGGSLVSYEQHTHIFDVAPYTDKCTICSAIKDGHNHIDEDRNNECDTCGVPLTPESIVDFAYTILDGASVVGKYTLTGVVDSISGSTIVFIINDSQGNPITDKPMQAYNLSGEDVSSILKGDTITVTGSFGTYDGKVQFASGSSLDSLVPHNHVYPTEGYTANCTICGKTSADHSECADADNDGFCDACGLVYIPDEGGASWNLVTDIAELAAGDKVVIAAIDFDLAMSTTQNSNNRGQAAVVKGNGKITIGEDVQIITLEVGTKDGTFAFNTGNGYLYAASSGSNHLKLEQTLSDNSSWLIEIAADGTATIKAQGTNTRNWLRYNDYNDIFSAYGSGQNDVAIYKLSGGTTTEPCEHANTEAIGEYKAPTCKEEGLTAGEKCSDCEEIIKAQETINKLSHTEEEIPAVSATCTSVGYTAGVKCSACGDILKAPEAVEALGHTKEKIPAVAATCTATGLTEGTKCSVCKEVLLAQATTPITGHVEVPHEAKAPTCTEDGYFAYVTCENCNYTTYQVNEKTGHSFTKSAHDETHHWYACANAGCSEIDGKEAHAFDDNGECTSCSYGCDHEVGTPATCEKQAICSKCEKPFGDLAEHTSQAVEAKDPTCTETGLTAGEVCSVCDKVLTAQSVVPSLGHTAVDDDAVAATCTKTGLTAGSHCSVCKEVLVAQEVVEALGHTAVTDAAKDATCTETGLTAGSHCSVCNEVLVAQEEVEALGHTVVPDAAVDATCTETGLTEGSHCSVCNEVLVAQEVVEATGHNLGDLIPEVEATCYKEGNLAYYHCSNCNKNYSEDNDEIEDVVLVTTEHKDSNSDDYCDECSKSFEITVKEALEIAAKYDHNTYTTYKYTIKGTIKEITGATYGNIIIEDTEGNTIATYGLYSADGGIVRYDAFTVKPAVGDEIVIYGIIGTYNGASQVKNPWLKEHTYGDTLTAVCTVCGSIDKNHTECNNDADNNGICDDCGKDLPKAGETIVTIDLSTISGNYTENTSLTELTFGNIVLTFDKGTHTLLPVYNINDKGIRVYKNNLVTVTSTDGTVITKIEFTASAMYLTADNLSDKTWTLEGGAESVQFNGGTGTSKISVITITLYNCEHTNTEPIGEAQAATCTENGITAGVKCADCGKELTAQEIIPATGHDFADGTCTVCGAAKDCDHTNTESIGEAKAATCTEAGITAGSKCSDCGETIEEQEVIPALGHSYVNYVCNRCGTDDPDHYFAMTIAEALAATDGKQVEVTGTVVKINTPLNSEYNNISVTIKDTEGNELYLYRLSGDVALHSNITVKGSMSTYNGTRQISQGATFTLNGTEACSYSAATCTTPEKCAICGAEKEGSVALGHTAGTAATCTTAQICTVCEAVIVEALGHTYVDGVCSVCGEAESAGGEETVKYELVTDASTLKAGDKVIIVAIGSDYALSTTQNNNNRAQTAVTKEGNYITPDATVQILTLEAGTTDGTFAFNTGSGYLYAASSSKNYLKTETTLSDNSSWTIEIASDGVATVKAQGTYTRNWLRYNSSSSIFSCYSSGQADIAIYKLV